MDIKSWTQFLNNLKDLCHHRLTFPDRQRYRDIESLVDDVVKELLKPNLPQDVCDAVDDMKNDPDEMPAIGFLEREVEWFNDLILNYRTRSGELDIKSEEETGDAIGAGTAIKESFEKQIKRLPKRVQRILEILNEILKIIKGG